MHLLCPSSGVIYCTFDTGSFMQVFDDIRVRFQAESGWNCVPSWLCLETVIKNQQELSTVHSALVSFMQVLMTAESTSKQSVFHPGSAWKRSSKPTRNLPVPILQWKTPDNGQRRCMKHVEFYNRINLDN